MKAKITEIFKSLQGEGIYRGASQIFVRFFGCNLRCDFCDTKSLLYSEKSLDEVLADVCSYSDCNFVSLTGGEPLMQIDFLKQLVKELKKNNKCLYLETNGTLSRNLEDIVDYIDVISMDFKLPSSTKIKDYWNEHEKFLRIARRREVFAKAVIGQETQLRDLQSGIKIIKEVMPDLVLVLQPQNPWEELLKEKLECFSGICRKENIDFRVIEQWHKKVGVK